MSTPRQLEETRSVFDIPELVAQICNLLEIPECLSLLVTCRFCFPIVAARVWARVDNARVLLALLKSFYVGQTHFNEFKNDHIIVGL
jgi:hypothetical protein